MQEPLTLNRMARGDGASKMFPEGHVIAVLAEDGYIYAQVRIAGVHTNVPDADLPKYRILIPNEQSGHNDANAVKLCRITPGSLVQMLLYDDYGYNGVVLGSFATKPQDASVLHGWSDVLGNTLHFKADKGVDVMLASGVRLVISPAGAVAVDCQSYTVRSVDISLSATGTMSLRAAEWDVQSDNPTIIDGAGGAAAPDAPQMEAPIVPAAPDFSNKIEW